MSACTGLGFKMTTKSLSEEIDVFFKIAHAGM